MCSPAAGCTLIMSPACGCSGCTAGSRSRLRPAVALYCQRYHGWRRRPLQGMLPFVIRTLQGRLCDITRPSIAQVPLSALVCCTTADQLAATGVTPPDPQRLLAATAAAAGLLARSATQVCAEDYCSQAPNDLPPLCCFASAAGDCRCQWPVHAFACAESCIVRDDLIVQFSHENIDH